MTTTRTILRNSFHGTHYVSHKSREELEAIENRVIGHYNATPADKALVRKVWSALCGISDCTCGQNSYGERS